MITQQMKDATTPDAMADAFHPEALGGWSYHRYAVLDVVEVALLWAAGRAGQGDFISALGDSPIFMDAIAGELNERPPSERT